MSSAAVPQPVDPPAPLSEVSRVSGVFASPKTAFADIVARPRWYVPIILTCLTGLCFVILLNQHIGFERIIQQQMDSNPRTQTMPPEQRAQALKMGLAIGRPFAFVTALAAPPLSVLVVAAVLLFLANSMLGGQLRYGQMCAISAYAFLTSVVSAILTIIVMFIRSPDDFDIRNPLAFNFGAFLNADSTPKWLLSLATSFDLFSFWTMALLAIGIMVAIRKVSFGKAFVTVLIPWAIVVFLKAGWAGIFG